MKKFSPLLMLGCSIILSGACESPPPEADLTEQLAETIQPAPQPPEIALLAPESVATLEKNDYVTVMRIDLAPGGSIPEHDADRQAVYALNDSSLWVTADGNAHMLTYAAGDTDTWAAGRYQFENAGDTAAELVIVARSDAPLPESAAGANERASTDEPPTPQDSADDDTGFEIMDVVVEPGEPQSLQCDHPCVLYTVTPATISSAVSASGVHLDKTEVYAIRALWFDGGSHPVVQAGDETARLVAFEITK